MKINVDELLPICGKCEGSGKMEDPILKRNQGNSFGTRVVGASPVDCDNCAGNGVIVTESARGLIEFINRAKSKMLIR